jgi:hypothetical protein
MHVNVKLWRMMIIKHGKFTLNQNEIKKSLFKVVVEETQCLKITKCQSQYNHFV